MFRVGLAEDHAELRTTLRLFLGLAKNIEVVFEAKNGREAVEAVQQHQPDVLVMDVRMPKLDGLAAARQIADLSLPTRVILITSFKGPGIMQAVIDAGAHGFVSKDELIELLLLAVETVGHGSRFFTKNTGVEVIHEKEPNSS